MWQDCSQWAGTTGQPIPRSCAQIAQVLVIIFPDALPLRLDGLPDFQLGVEKGRQDVTHHITRTHVHPGIFVHLTAKEPAAVRPLFPNDFRPFNQPRIIDEQRAALAAGDVLGFMKTLGRQAAKCAQPAAPEFAEQAVRIVFHHGQRRAGRQSRQSHPSRNPPRHNGPGQRPWSAMR